MSDGGLNTRLELTKVIRGAGQLQDSDSSYPAHVFELQGDLYDASKGWNLTIHFEEPEGEHFFDRVQLSADPVLEGYTEDGRRLRVPAVRWRRHQHRLLIGEADRIEIGVERLPEVPEIQYLYARLSPSNVAVSLAPIPVRSWTGEIKSDKEREAPAIQTDLGLLKFCLAYDYEDVSFSGGKGMARLPVPRLTLAVPQEQQTCDTEALISGFEDICNGVCSFLSLLSRRRVVWMSIHHSARWKEPAPGFLESTVYRHTVSTPEPNLLDQLVNGWQLEGEEFSNTYERWCGLSYHDSMRKASSFLHQCFLSGHMEDRALSAFIALETLTDGFSQDRGILHLVDDEELRTLRAELKPVVNASAKGMGLSKETRKGLYAKLGELRMAPLVPRVVALIEASEVRWDDLWPAGTQLEEALRVAYSRRSELVHAGKTDSQGLFRDTVRLHALTERVIYALCGAPAQWLHGPAYSQVQYVSSQPL